MILELDVPEQARFSFLVMMHAHVVSTIEGYLAGAFIHQVCNSEELTRKLVESDPEFSTGLTHQCLYFEQPHTFEQILFIQTAEPALVGHA